MAKLMDFEEWESKQLQDPDFVAELEELEAAYEVARLRMLKGLTQQQLADLVGTKQSGIARLESGKSQPRLSFLRRIVKAMGGKLELRILAEDEIDTESKYVPIAPIHVNLVFFQPNKVVQYSTDFRYESEIKKLAEIP